MDVRLSPEQQALRDSAAQVVDRLGPKAVRDLDDRERADKLDAAVQASGWRELRVAGEDGGPLASAVEAALVAEELSRGLADTAYLGPTLAAELRRLAGADPEEAAETVLMRADLSAPAQGADGAMAVALDARHAAFGLVLTAAEGGYLLGRVALDGPGGSGGTGGPGAAGRPGGVDLTRPVVPVPGGAQVVPIDGSTALGPADLQRWTALALALSSADLVGVMRGAVSVATEYAKSRKQYGVAIGTFQAVQHMLADAQVAMEGSRSVALHAAWAVDALAPADAVAAGAVAKAYCARAARAVCETGIQVHGGIGNTWECLAHVFLRRALLSTEVAGGVGPNLTRVLEHQGIGGGHGLQ